MTTKTAFWTPKIKVQRTSSWFISESRSTGDKNIGTYPDVETSLSFFQYLPQFLHTAKYGAGHTRLCFSYMSFIRLCHYNKLIVETLLCLCRTQNSILSKVSSPKCHRLASVVWAGSVLPDHAPVWSPLIHSVLPGGAYTSKSSPLASLTSLSIR